MIDLNEIREKALKAVADVDSLQKLEEFRILYLGKKGPISEAMKEIPSLPQSERPLFGQEVNKIKKELEEKLNEKKIGLDSSSKKEVKADFDITLPGKKFPRGKKHPITTTMEELVSIFKRLGFSVATGPDVETEYYNFEALNIPAHHPSRDMWSTFWLENGMLLRTHTSPVQIRTMEKEKPPLAYIIPGRVYRRDADATHSPVFHQLEGLMVDTEMTFSDLKGILSTFLRAVFGNERKVRFRPSYFPFTEPSAEVDVECFVCKGKGCRLCSSSGWLEILGSGMIDPNVFKYVGYDPEKYSGFAFGLGIERIAMLKHGIDDIRLFYENDMRFLAQF